MNFQKFDNFSSGAHLSFLNRFIVLINLVPIDLWLVFEVYAKCLIVYFSNTLGEAKPYLLLSNSLVNDNGSG